MFFLKFSCIIIQITLNNYISILQNVDKVNQVVLYYNSWEVIKKGRKVKKMGPFVYKICLKFTKGLKYNFYKKGLEILDFKFQIIYFAKDSNFLRKN